MAPKSLFLKLRNRTRIETKIQSNYGHMSVAVVFYWMPASSFHALVWRLAWLFCVTTEAN
jgi:hypothetical protein